MSEMPKLLIYECAEAPPGELFIGFFSLQSGRLPMAFSGSTRDAVQKCATEWWEKEVMKVDRRRAKEQV